MAPTDWNEAEGGYIDGTHQDRGYLLARQSTKITLAAWNETKGEHIDGANREKKKEKKHSLRKKRWRPESKAEVKCGDGDPQPAGP